MSDVLKRQGARETSGARAAAKAAGEVYYFTGLPCRRGHVAKRLTSNSACVDCVVETRAEKDRRYAEKNREAYRLKAKKWREENLERARAADRGKYWRNREENLKRMRKRYAANRQKDMERKRQAYRENIKVMRKKQRARYAANPTPWQTASRNRKARLRQAEGSHTTVEIKTLFKRQRQKCAWCATSIWHGYHVDHIVPLSKGGTNWIANIQLLCAPCNLRKRAKLPHEFALEEGRLL